MGTLQSALPSYTFRYRNRLFSAFKKYLYEVTKQAGYYEWFWCKGNGCLSHSYRNEFIKKKKGGMPSLLLISQLNAFCIQVRDSLFVYLRYTYWNVFTFLISFGVHVWLLQKEFVALFYALHTDTQRSIKRFSFPSYEFWVVKKKEKKKTKTRDILQKGLLQFLERKRSLLWGCSSRYA